MFKFDSFLSFEKLEKIKQEKEADKRSLSLFEVEPYLSSISKTILKIRRNGGGIISFDLDLVTFLVEVVIPAVVVADVVSVVSSTEKFSASLHGSASSPHCLRKTQTKSTPSSFSIHLIYAPTNSRAGFLPRALSIGLKIFERGSKKNDKFSSRSFFSNSLGHIARNILGN